MNVSSCSLLVLAALGALSPGASHAAVDTSQWKCELCPFEKEGRSATLEAGVGAVSDASPRFGEFTGLQRKGAFAVLGGQLRYRGTDGVYGSLTASDLGLDVRALQFDGGREGLYTLRLGYAEIPRHQADGASTPFLGVGGTQLTLPGGYPAVDTAAMPLAGTLRPVDIESKRSRFDASIDWIAPEPWSTRLSVRRDVRDGTLRSSGSFFSSASQLAAPLDQVTDQLEASLSWTGPRLQATLAYQVSLFRNNADSLTWANPFTPVVPGSTAGQLALAPDNTFQQVVASGGYQVTPWLRASGEIAAGQITQDVAFLAPTLNTSLAATLPALPAASLGGRVDTFDASVRLTATPAAAWRINGSYARDVRDNRTPSAAYPAVSTDMFFDPLLVRTNQPFSFTQDRFKLDASYRGAGRVRGSLGVDEDDRERTRQEVARTRETTVWGRAQVQALDELALALKLAHARRDASTYGVAAWIDPPENPLLRKFYLADRRRDSAALRADAALGEGVSVGLSADYAKDDYNHSTIGLLDGRSASLGGDFSAVVSDQTSVHGYVQSERARSRQAGSQVFAQPDWTARNRDVVDVVGFGLRHQALKGRLELGFDAVRSRGRNDVSVDAGAASPPFPTARTIIDSVRLRAVYRLQDNVSIVGTWWHERFQAQDWHLDGVLPGAVSNLLAFGEQPANFRIDVLQLAVRYRF
jgi:MtrB/PioB family decaheme-associated outer membrane protein